jgi:hypothetical protein
MGAPPALKKNGKVWGLPCIYRNNTFAAAALKTVSANAMKKVSSYTLTFRCMALWE